MKWCRIGAVGFALAGLLVAATFAIGVPPALAVTSWVTTQLTSGAPDRMELQISGNRAVWLAMGGGYTQVFTQKLGVDPLPSQLTTDANNHEAPQVSGDRVVWRAYDGANDQVFTQKIDVDASPSQLTTDADDHYWPGVSGDRIVWIGRDGGHYQVFTQKLGADTSPIQLTTDAHDQSGPQVSGDRVVWEGMDDVYHYQVFTQKIGVDSSPSQLTTTNDHYGPQVSGDRVVWMGNDPAASPTWEVFTQKIGVDSSPSEITTDSADHEWAKISGDRIVWQQWVGSMPQVYTMEMGVDTSPVDLTAAQGYYHDAPQVSGDRVVWSAYAASGGKQVFTQDVGSDASPVQLTTAPAGRPQQYPLVSGDRIVWYSYDGTYQQISTAAPAYRLHYVADAHGSVVGSSTQVVAFDGSGTPVTAMPVPGYRFVKWSDDSTANPRTETHVTADATFTAAFAINPVYSTSLKLSGLASVKVKKSYKVSGTIKPGAAVGRVKILWKRYYSGGYHTVKTVYATIASGKFSSSYKPTKRGKWRAYVSYATQYAPRATYKASATVYKTFTVK